MQAKTKRLSITLLICALCMCLVCGLVPTFSSAKADTPSLTLKDFTTTAGASISTSGPLGMKFQATISKDDYDSVIGADANAQFGMAIARGNVDSVDAFVEYAKAHTEIHYANETWDVDHTPEDEAETLSYSFIINDIAEAKYGVNYTAIGYVKVNGEYIYSSASETAITRSPLIVAINYVCNDENVNKVDDEFAYEIISVKKPTLVFDNSAYGAGDKPVVTVNDVVVNPTLVSSNTNAFEIVDGAIVAKALGTGTLTAKVEGLNNDVFSATANVTISPVISKSGILTTYTNGETATVKVNDGASDIITETVPTETFDLYDAIISYREVNGITDAKAYTVSVTSASYSGSTTTATINAIGDKASFRGMVDRADRTTDNNYFYLTSSIEFDESTGGFGTGYKLFCSSEIKSGTAPHETTFNLDGRGYTLKVDYSNTAGGDRWMFDRIINSSIKNVSVDFNVELYYIQQAMFANIIRNTTIENCYFAMTIKCGHPSKTGTRYFAYDLNNATFNNCVFNFTDNSADKSTPVKLGLSSEHISVTNCAISYNDQTGLNNLFETYQEINASIYSSMPELLTAESAKAWSDSWQFGASSLKLCGKSVYQKSKAIKGEPTVDGIVTFNDGVGALDITLCSATGAEIATLATGYTGATYDAYTAIADYRIANSITTNASYIVKFEGASAADEFTTATIIAMGDTADFRTKMGDASATENVLLTGNYYYLTQDISFTADSASIYQETFGGDSVFLQTTGGDRYINLDGRGFEIKANIDRPTGGTRRMFDGFRDSLIKNVYFEYTAKLVHAKTGTLANRIMNCTFENCYFKWATTFSAPTKPTELAMSVTSSFNNCIFEFIDNYADDYGMRFSDNGTIDLTNCAIVNADTSATLANIMKDSNTGDITNTTIYTSLQNLVNGEYTDTSWSGALKVTNQGITLCGKSIADITATVSDT